MPCRSPGESEFQCRCLTRKIGGAYNPLFGNSLCRGGLALSTETPVERQFKEFELSIAEGVVGEPVFSSFGLKITA